MNHNHTSHDPPSQEGNDNMAQPQQQSYHPGPMQMPQPPFSPPNPSNSPGPQHFAAAIKRQRISPNPSQPGSPAPYLQSPYPMSPNTTAPPSAGASPQFANIQIPQGAYNTPYGNGHSTSGMNSASGLSLPQSQSNPQPFAHSPLSFSSLSSTQMNQPAQTNPQPYNNFAMAPQAPGTMGPPLKPAEKAKEDVQNDVMDVLGGTGIDLADEERFAFQLYNNDPFNSQQSGTDSGTFSSGRSFTQYPPGDPNSFYGAGPANAAAEIPDTQSQEEFHKKAADKAWHDAAHQLAVSRQRELNNPFLQVGLIHARMQKTARDNGLELHEGINGQMGTMKLPEHFPKRDVQVSTVIGPNGAFVTTSGNFLPADSMVVDQLALLSIATKRRLEDLLGDAYRLAKGRQTGSHGIVPEEWADVAAPNVTAGSSLVPEGAPRSGWESAVNPHSYPRKRSFSTANQTSSSAKTSSGSGFTNDVVRALQSSAKEERDREETRLQKRLARSSGENGTPRAGSVVPGTPGSVAPDYSEKAPTKKEAKKKAEAKVNEAASHAAANQTTFAFLGPKRKKGGRDYAWMTAATPGGSGASTPSRIVTQGLPGTHGVNSGPARLTADPVRRIGGWRESDTKGKGIQMRDWITVLEDDGHEKKALQKVYVGLDQSDPK